MNFIRDLLKPALMLATVFAVAQAAELPPIEMPDVVISGVERATVIRAERLPASPAAPEFTLAEGFSTERPAIQAQSIEIMPSRPMPVDFLRFAYFGGRLGGGNLTTFGGRLEAGAPIKMLSIGLRGRIDNPPQRIRVGELSRGGGEVSLTHDALYRSQAFYKLGYSQESFRLRENQGDRRWKDFFGGFNWSSVHSPAGIFAGNFAFDLWDENEHDQTGGSGWQGNLNHRLDLGAAELENRASCQYEPLDADNDQLGVFAVRSLVGFQALESLEIRVGLTAYSGYTARFSRQAGIDPNVEFTWNLSSVERVSIAWEPGYEIFTTREIARDYPMIVNRTGGTIAEDFARLSAFYDRRLNERVRLKFQLKYQDSPHYPLPLSEIDDGWALGTTRLRWFQTQLKTQWLLTEGLSASGAVGFNNARAWNPNLKQAAPQIEPWFVEAELVNDGEWFDEAFRIRWRDDAAVGLDDAAVGLLDDRRIPSHWESELWMACTLGRGWGAFLEAANLLNDRWWTIPGYEVPPLAIKAGFSYGSGINRLLRKDF